MNTTRNKYLFLDFDECLVSSLYVRNDQDAEGILDICYDLTGVEIVLHDNDRYVSFLRPSTPEVLDGVWKLMGKENVFVLSTGTHDYLTTATKKLGLDFPDSRIFGREMLRIGNPPERFRGSFNVLVDNESYEHHWRDNGKIAFLHNLPRDNYIKVPSFHAITYKYEENHAEWLLAEITKKMAD